MKYSTLIRYLEGMRSTPGYEIPNCGGVMGTTANSVGSNERNYITQMYQRMIDNGMDLGEGQEFYDKLYNGQYINIDSGAMQAMAYACVQLDRLQSNGQIDMATYQSMMLNMISPQSIEALETYNYDSFVEFTHGIDDLQTAGKELNSDDIDDNIVSNAATLRIDRRPVIDSRDDYLTAARERRGVDPSVDGSIPDQATMYTDMVNMIEEANKSGYFETEEDYQAAKSLLNQFDNKGGMTVSATDREIMYYAMQDSLATGDSELINKVFSKDGFESVGSMTFWNGKDGDSIAIFRELEDARIRGTTPAGPEPAVYNDEVTPTQDRTYKPMSYAEDSAEYAADQMERPGVVLSEDRIQTITDTMIANYFEGASEDGGLTAERYDEMKAEYEGLSPDEQAAYLQNNIQFRMADAYVSQVDTLAEGLNSGRFELCATVDENGNETFGIRYNEAADRYFERATETYLDNNVDSIVTRDPYTDEYSLAGGPGTMLPGGLPAGEELSHAPFNLTVNGLKGLDAACKEVGVSAPQVYNDGTDYDAKLAENDLDLVMAQSPMERFDTMLAATAEVWGGKYGNGAPRMQALQDAGFTAEEAERIQQMVNLGPDWYKTATAEDYDKAFSAMDGGVTLAEQDASFRTAQAEAASRLMTYEGADDLLARFNAGAGEDSPTITEEQAAAVYDRAAHVLDSAYADGVGPAEVSSVEHGESMKNLADYIADNPEAGFSAGISEDGKTPVWLDQQDPNYDNDGKGDENDGYQPGD